MVRIFSWVRRLFGFGSQEPPSVSSDFHLIVTTSLGVKSVSLSEDKHILVGRDTEAQIVLDHGMVSRRHAKIVCRNGIVTVEDLRSSNGTYVNGDKITEPRVLEVGQAVVIADVTIRLCFKTK